jgi:hypothetical protein
MQTFSWRKLAGIEGNENVGVDALARLYGF